MKKGFTLIELLAVIVILAIIALIAVPIVLGIINDSKKEAKERSIDLYIDTVKKSITKYQMSNSNFNPKTCYTENNKVNCEGTEIEVDVKGQVPEYGVVIIEDNKTRYDIVLEDTEYIMDSNGEKKTQKAPSVALKNVDYRGYYADVDWDGEPDGVIYADLNRSESGEWNDWNGRYSYETQTDLNEYTVSKEKYNGIFGDKEIIKLKKDTLNSRFYVMALNDFTIGSMTGDYDGRYFWYKNALYKMSTYEIDTGVAFGKGYDNTGTIIDKWKKNGYGVGSYEGAMQDDHDIWKHIQSEYAKGWYIPSKGEWTAFGDYFSTRTENTVIFGWTGNYNTKYGLSELYWSSSQLNESVAWLCALNAGSMSFGNVDGSLWIRLGITF